MLSPNIPFVYVAFAEELLSSNSTSTGMSVWYFLSPFSACTVTYLSDTFTLISSLFILGFAYAVPSIHSDHVALAAKTKCKSVDKEDETKKQL